MGSGACRDRLDHRAEGLVQSLRGFAVDTMHGSVPSNRRVLFELKAATELLREGVSLLEALFRHHRSALIMDLDIPDSPAYPSSSSIVLRDLERFVWDGPVEISCGSVDNGDDSC